MLLYCTVFWFILGSHLKHPASDMEQVVSRQTPNSASHVSMDRDHIAAAACCLLGHADD